MIEREREWCGAARRGETRRETSESHESESVRANVCVRHCCCVLSCFCCCCCCICNSNCIVSTGRTTYFCYGNIRTYFCIVLCIFFNVVIVVNKMLLEIDDKTRQINNAHTHTAHVVNGGA